MSITAGAMQFTRTPVPATSYDLPSILTHEVGHFLGMAHSTEPCTVGGDDCPTMNPFYTTGSDAYRSLEADDVAGICAVYPPSRKARNRPGASAMPNVLRFGVRK